MNHKDIYPLWLFSLVAKERSFTKAAAIAHISQPPLSNHIKNLERRLGVELFERTTREVTLSQYGRAIYPVVEKYLELTDSFFERIDSATRGEETKIKFGSFAWLLKLFVVPMINGIKQNEPLARLGAERLDSLDAPSLTRNLDIDIAYAYKEPLGKSGLLIEEVAKFRIDVGVSSNHPLAGRKEISLKELSESKCVCIHPGVSPGLYTFHSELAEKFGFELFTNTGIRDFMDQSIEVGISNVFSLFCEALEKLLPDNVVFLKLKEPLYLTLIRISKEGALSPVIMEKVRRYEKEYFSKLAGTIVL